VDVKEAQVGIKYSMRCFKHKSLPKRLFSNGIDSLLRPANVRALISYLVLRDAYRRFADQAN